VDAKHLIILAALLLAPPLVLAVILKMIAQARIRHQAIIGKKVEKAFFTTFSVFYYSCTIKESGKEYVLEFAARKSPCTILVRINLLETASITVGSGSDTLTFATEEPSKAGWAAASLMTKCEDKQKKGPS
jgi:hypothetical protein